MRRTLAGLVLAGAVGGCTTLGVPPNETSLRPLLRALTEPVETLASAARTGQSEAQLAYSILEDHRLRGVRSSTTLPYRLRLALTSRPTSRPTPIYVPGVKGRPGTVSNVPVTIPDPRIRQAEVVEGCVAALESEWEGAAKSCGGPALHARLRTLWAQAKVDPRTTAEALARLTCDPAEIRGVNQAAGEAYNAAGANYQNTVETDRAIALTERIIAVCGETGPSWPARAVRADIALTRNAPAEALRLLAPVPRPAPPPVGAAPAWLALNAHAAVGDWNGYARQRDALMAASERALAATGRERERIRVGGWRLADYDVDQAGGLGQHARRIILATPEEPRAAPRALYLYRTSLALPGLEALTTGEPLGWKLVEYQCYKATTVKQWEGGSTPDPTEVRRLALERLAAPAEPAPAREPDEREWTPGSCGFPQQIAPGLG